MQSFSGWLGSGLHPDSANDILKKMSGYCSNSARQKAGSKLLEGFGIAYCDLNSNHHYNETSKCFFIIIGHPNWRDNELSSFSAQYGHAKALELAYTKYNAGLFNYLFGTFSVLIFDSSNNSVLVAVDRMGTYPMYYTTSKSNTFVFGSTAASINEFPSIATEIDYQSLYDYLFFHVVPSPDCIFKNQQKLLAAQFVLYKNNKFQTNTYWKPGFAEEITHPNSQESSKIISLLTDEIEKKIPDNSYGCFLSGGVDSSTVTALLDRVSNSPVNTFSIGFNEEAYNELGYAKIVADHFKTNHHEYYVTPDDVITAIPLIAKSYDEPFGNSSAVPVYYCAKLAHDNGIKTLFAGDAGDELFAGNERYAKQKVFEYYNYIPQPIRKLLEIGTDHSVNIPKPFSKIQSYIKQAKIPLPDRLQWYNYLKQTDVSSLISDDLITDIDTDHPFKLMRNVYNVNADASTLNKMLYLDWQYTLADNDIRKVSTMCAMSDIDPIYPFLGDAVVDYSCKLKSSTKLTSSKLRYFFKKSVEDILPNEVLTKSKQGFGLPFGVWMKNYTPLKELAYDSVEAMKKRHYIKPAYLDRLLHLHQSDHAHYYGEFIWVIMMLEIWLQNQSRI